MSDFWNNPERPKPVSVAYTQITSTVRVSTAGVPAEYSVHWGSGYYLRWDTWIFSDDPRQHSTQIIHTCRREAEKVHKYVAANMQAKFNK